LAKGIAARLREGAREVTLYEAIGDEVAGSGLATGALGNVESVRAFVTLHRAREAAPAAVDVQIFDRCLLDAFAYAYVLGCLPRPEFEDLRRATLESSTRLTRVLWLRVTHDYPVVSPLDETPEFRRAIDVAVGQLARE